jgi:hypothetical protein
MWSGLSAAPVRRNVEGTKLPFLPSVEGTVTIRSQARAFVDACARRMEAGLLGPSDRRSRYHVTRADDSGLAFRASDWPTAMSVGLNDVELSLSNSGSVRYRIHYPRWAAYALALSALIGVVLAACFLLFDLRSYVARQPGIAFLALTEDQAVTLAWSMVVFWGFMWPWILIALHKRPLRRLIERIIAEVDATTVQNPTHQTRI